MGKKKPVCVGHLQFEMQKDALEHMREILRRYVVGQEVVGQDRLDVEAFLYNHPNAKEKIGSGVSRITVDADEQGGQCFHVIRADGTKDNFSYKKCVAGEPRPFTSFSLACRRAVDDELHEFKVKYFASNGDGGGRVRCPETKRLIGFDEAHVDHKSPKNFSVIVDSFINAENLDLARVQYKKRGLYGHELADDALAGRFRTWHRKMAVLRVIKNSRNLAKAFMGRVKPTLADRTLGGVG